MKRVDRSEVLDLGSYESIRPHFRSRVIALKKLRRVALGSNMSVLFENHDTALFQIQEMLRTERITREDAVQHEIETYNDLVPGVDELSATVFIEYPDADERERMLTELAGVESAFYLVVDGERVAVRSETRGTRTDRTTAVHYVKFPLTESAAAAFRGSSCAVLVGVDHAAYTAEVAMTPDTVTELRADLDPES